VQKYVPGLYSRCMHAHNHHDYGTTHSHFLKMLLRVSSQKIQHSHAQVNGHHVLQEKLEGKLCSLLLTSDKEGTFFNDAKL